jgi:serine/threonine protein kinase/WD40 repeat protein
MAGDDGILEPKQELVDEIVARFVEAVDSGQAPDRLEWLQRHPEAAADLTAFFADQDCFKERLAPLWACVSGKSSTTNGRFPTPGTRVGDYELLEEIARGGMGIVFKARQLQLNRTVALKMILTGETASDDEQRRFQLEAESAGRLDHPNIVPVYEINAWEGQPYFSMRLIEGGSLADALAVGRCPAAGKQGPRWSAELVSTVARAVHFAHQRGVLHRDLKPANILLDPENQPHITDFGLAKWLQPESDFTNGELPALASLLSGGRAGEQTTTDQPGRPTQTGVAVGTPSYMAPEQVLARVRTSAVSPRGLTPATDVYSLGVILYELLTGIPPFRGATVLDTLRSVTEDPPVPPRVRKRSLPHDLQTICLKCLEKEPERRYGSALALAEDLDRFLRGEPIVARPVGPIGRLWRWCRRQPALAASLALAGSLSGLLLAFILTGLLAHRDAEAAVHGDRYSNVQGGKHDVESSDDAPSTSGLHRGSRANLSPLANLDPARVPAEDRLAKIPGLVAVLKGAGSPIFVLAFSPDSKYLASAGLDGIVSLWELTGAAPRRIKQFPSLGGVVVGLAFSNDGQKLAYATKSRARICDMASPDLHQLLPDVVLNLPTNPALAFAPDSKTLAVAGDGGVLLVDVTGPVATIRAGPTGHLDHVRSVVFSHDGKTMVTAGSDDTVRVWDMDVQPAGERFVLHSTKPNQPSWHATLSPDGKTVAVGYGSTVHLWDLSGPKPVLRWAPKSGHREWANSVAFSPDGQTLVSTGGGVSRVGPHNVVWWNALDGAIRKVWELPERCAMGAFAPSGLFLALTCHNGNVYILDLDRGTTD